MCRRARSTPPSKRPRANSASISSPTAPTSHTSARSARPVSRIWAEWTTSAAVTCWPTVARCSARSTSCLETLTDERAPPCSARTAAEGLLLQRQESRLGQGPDRQISGRPEALGGNSALVAGAGAGRRLAAGSGDPLRRRFPRHGAHPRARGRDLLYHVQSGAGRQNARAALRHDAVPPARRRRI